MISDCQGCSLDLGRLAHRHLHLSSSLKEGEWEQHLALTNIPFQRPPTVLGIGDLKLDEDLSPWICHSPAV